MFGCLGLGFSAHEGADDEGLEEARETAERSHKQKFNAKRQGNVTREITTDETNCRDYNMASCTGQVLAAHISPMGMHYELSSLADARFFGLDLSCKYLQSVCSDEKSSECKFAAFLELRNGFQGISGNIGMVDFTAGVEQFVIQAEIENRRRPQSHKNSGQALAAEKQSQRKQNRAEHAAIIYCAGQIFYGFHQIIHRGTSKVLKVCVGNCFCKSGDGFAKPMPSKPIRNRKAKAFSKQCYCGQDKIIHCWLFLCNVRGKKTKADHYENALTALSEIGKKWAYCAW